MDWLALVALVALLQYFYFGILVGRARTRAGIAAPMVTGDPVFERTFRVQQNSLEQMVIFLPAAYLFAHYMMSSGSSDVVQYTYARPVSSSMLTTSTVGGSPGMLNGSKTGTSRSRCEYSAPANTPASMR